MTKGTAQLSDNVWFIQAPGMGKYPFANSLLIKDRTNCIIDLGVGVSILGELSRDIRVDKVVFSHCHEDHTSGSFLFPGASFYAHSLDVDAIESVDKLKERYLVKGTELEKVFDKFFFESLNLRDCRIDGRITDGYVFDLGKTELRVMHTPGHSAGHCCFQEESSGILFLSDIDLSSFGPWYGCADSDICDFISSIRRLMNVKAEILVSSHKGIIHGDIRRRLEEFLNKIFEREQRILSFLDNQRSLREIIDKALIYGRFGEPKEAYVLMESVMINKHLEKLLEEGRVIYAQGKYSAT